MNCKLKTFLAGIIFSIMPQSILTLPRRVALLAQDPTLTTLGRGRIPSVQLAEPAIPVTRNPQIDQTALRFRNLLNAVRNSMATETLNDFEDDSSTQEILFYFSEISQLQRNLLLSSSNRATGVSRAISTTNEVHLQVFRILSAAAETRRGKNLGRNLNLIISSGLKLLPATTRNLFTAVHPNFLETERIAPTPTIVRSQNVARTNQTQINRGTNPNQIVVANNNQPVILNSPQTIQKTNPTAQQPAELQIQKLNPNTQQPAELQIQKPNPTTQQQAEQQALSELAKATTATELPQSITSSIDSKEGKAFEETPKAIEENAEQNSNKTVIAAEVVATVQSANQQGGENSLPEVDVKHISFK
ncbi:expressed protein [Phakopsora pachyrhizi]|uniref:Expressed protein n=1 Tax=Phakopsora pachyrhizi TaxID=170000 RepID=A0AAV0BK77_PHAPC|nr:expressed protein [Phakopsora pachyrhizi]